MGLSKGKGSNAKIIMTKLNSVEGDTLLYGLTDRQVYALLSLTDYLRWPTRHSQLPDDIDSPTLLREWVDALDNTLMMPLDFCAAMIENADCFFDDIGVQELFDQKVIQSLDNPDVIDKLTNVYNTYIGGVSPELLGQNLMNENCEPDNMYAQVVQLVDTLDGLTVDVLQLVDQVSGVIARVGALISAIPALEATPVPSLFDFVTNTITGMKLEYDGTYTESLEIDLKCDLLCLVKDSCEISFLEVQAYYLNKANIELNNITSPIKLVDEILQYLITGDVDGDIVVYALHAFACSILSAGSSFLGETFEGLVALIYSQRDEVNNDWEDLCENCPDPEEWICLDTIGSTGGFTPWLHPFSGLAAAEHTSEGWDTGYNAGFCAIQKHITGRIIAVKITLARDLPPASETTSLIQVKEYDGSGGADNEGFHEVSELLFTELSIEDGLYINVQTSSAWPSDQKIIEICYKLGL